MIKHQYRSSLHSKKNAGDNRCADDKFIFRGKWLRRGKRICRGEEAIQALTEAELQQQLFSMREVFALGRETPADIDAAFALIREACSRILGMNPYPVQVAGALLIEHGLLAEMATEAGMPRLKNAGDYFSRK